jgi:glycine/sarcosine N-methyltransferase
VPDFEDAFADIATDYDHMFPRDLSVDSRMLEPSFTAHHVRTILDCACGTGIHVAMLAQQGYDVSGSDASDAMLDQARLRLASQDIEAPLYQALWSELPQVISERFDAVICIGNSLPLAGSDEQVQTAVAGMYEMVNPGGVLLVQNRNMDKMEAERPGAIINDGGGGYVVFIFEYASDMVTYRVFFLPTSDDGGDVTYNEFLMNVLTRAKFTRMLADLGVNSPAFYGDSYRSRFSRTRSPRMIVEVAKPSD